MPRLNDIINEHEDEIDAIVAEFMRRLESMVQGAVEVVLEQLAGELGLSGGVIEATSQNQRILNSVDKRFVQALDAQGYQQMLENYVQSFNGQFVWFDKVLETINADLKFKLPPTKLTRGQMAQLEAYQVSAKDVIDGAVKRVATNVKQQAILSVGGTNVKQLTKSISQSFNKPMAEAQNLAETSISTFYRTITDKGFQLIEEDLPEYEIRYNYEGPLDKLTRPFCTKLERQSREGKTWTRKQINKMNNGQLPNVFTTCGGYRCRHQWVISAEGLKEQQEKKGAPCQPKRRVPTREATQEELQALRVVHSSKSKGKMIAQHPTEQLDAIRKQAEQAIQSRRAK